MIIFTEVAQKIQNILNGSDSEVGTSGSVVQATNPTAYDFQVFTEGIHIDNIKKGDRTGNFIPVYISSMGGQFNPVKGLKQGTYSIPIAFYYPVRFKNDFFALAEFLVDAFVGTILTYGETSGKAVSNISVPQFSEIANQDLTQFKTWVNATFERAIDRTEPYMSMNLTLYLTNSAQGFIYGNDFKTTFSYTYNENTYSKIIEIENANLQSNSNPQSEQEEGTNESEGLPFGTAYGMAFKVYPNIEETITVNTVTKRFWLDFLTAWLAGDIQTVRCTITFSYTYPAISQSLTGGTLTFTRNCFVQSVVAPIEKGQLFSLTFTLGKVVEEDEEEEE